MSLFNIEKLTETCYLCEEVGLAIVNPADSYNWIVIDKGDENNFSKVVFKSPSFEQCCVFVEQLFLGEKQ